MLQHARDEPFIDDAACGLIAVAVERRAGARAHEIIDQRVAGPGVAGDRIAAVDKGDVGDAADIDDHDRMRPVEIAGDRLMEHRHQRRALPAGHDVGLAEITSDRNTDPPRDLVAAPDLHREPRRRLVQDRLTMEADDVDAGAVDALGGEELLDRLHMGARDEGFRLGEHAGTRRAVGQPRAFRQRLPQQRPLVLAIGPVAGRPEREHPLAVRLDQRDIDPVERGAAHQADGTQHRAARLCHGLFGAFGRFSLVESDAGPVTPPAKPATGP